MNAATKKTITITTLMLLLAVPVLIIGNAYADGPGRGKGQRYNNNGNGYETRLDAVLADLPIEKQEKVKTLIEENRRDMYVRTQKISAEQANLRALLAEENPSKSKVMDTVKNINKLRSEQFEKAVEHRLALQNEIGDNLPGFGAGPRWNRGGRGGFGPRGGSAPCGYGGGGFGPCAYNVN